MKKLPYLLTLSAALTFACVIEEDSGSTADETSTSDSDSDSGDGDGDDSDSESASGDGDGDATDTDPATDTDTGDGDGDTGDGDGDGDTGDGDGDTGDGDGDTGDGDGDTGDGDGDTTGDGDGDGTDTGGEDCAQAEVMGWAVDNNGNLVIEDIMIADPDLADLARIEFYTDLAIGEVDLGSDDENNYQVCLHCFRVFEDIDGMDIARQYFQSQGILNITDLGGPGEVMATHSGVRLIEVTIAQDFVSTPVENGACIDIVDGEINTFE